MTEQYTLPQYSTFASLSSIARNVECSLLSKVESLTDGSFTVGKRERFIYLSFGDEELLFSSDSLQDFEIVPVEHAGRKFVAAAITFKSNDEASRYRVITSHLSEADWLRSVAVKMGIIIGRSPTDATRM